MLGIQVSREQLITIIDTFNDFYVNVGPNMHEVIPTETHINLKRSQVYLLYIV